MATGSKKLNIGLWVAQILLLAVYGLAGAMKATQPIPMLDEMMGGWPGQAPALARFIGVAEILGAIGMVAPMLTGIKPRLTLWAAAGLSLVQALAIPFHMYRGEFEALPVNIVLIALSLFVLWGRGRKTPL